MKKMRALFLVFIIAASMPLSLRAVSKEAPRIFPIQIENGQLTGPGEELIRHDLTNSQFILWGEDHGFADSAIVLRAIAREARPLGFRYHVVEVGPFSTEMIDQTLTKDGLSGLRKLVHDVPMGIPFLSLKDDAELASDFLGYDAKGQPFLWGVDQEFIGSPPFALRWLIALAPDKSARWTTEELLAQEEDASRKAAQDKFLLSRYHDADFQKLAAQFFGVAKAQQIIAELQESAAIYQAWMSGHNYQNNTRRARLLAKNFLANYRAAADPQPKVVFKMGIEHVSLGTTTVNTVDLGTLVSSIARLNDKSVLRIAFLPMGGQNVAFAPKPGNPTTIQKYESEESKEFFPAIGLDAAMLPKEGWALVPLEPIRQSLDTKGIDSLKRFSRFLLLGYDYVVTTADAKPGEFLYEK